MIVILTITEPKWTQPQPSSAWNYSCLYYLTEPSLSDAPSPCFRQSESDGWTTTNPANTATLSADHFPNLTDSSDKTNAI
ncbi:hypothetical protein MRX96_020312 [Rhipicephalus microplus]